MSALGFKVGMDYLACVLPRLHATDSSWPFVLSIGKNLHYYLANIIKLRKKTMKDVLRIQDHKS